MNELKHGAGAETVITVRYDEPVPGDLTERAGLTARPGVRSLAPTEWAEDAPPFAVRHARATVFHFQHDGPRAAGASGQPDPPIVGIAAILAGVVHQVANNLLQ